VNEDEELSLESVQVEILPERGAIYHGLDKNGHVWLSSWDPSISENKPWVKLNMSIEK